jgi:hypothetical protein
MSRVFGPLRQMGFVVRDIEVAMRHWVKVCGVGPWFYADRLAVRRSPTAGSATTASTSRWRWPTRATCNSSSSSSVARRPACTAIFSALGARVSSTGRAGPRTTTASTRGRWPVGTRWVRRARVRGGPSCTSGTRAIREPSSRWRSSRRRDAVSSIRSVWRRWAGTGPIPSAASGRADVELLTLEASAMRTLVSIAGPSSSRATI